MDHALSRISIPDYTLAEELLNAISHGIGAACSLLGLVLLVLKSSGPAEVICSCVFGVAMVALYTVSCLYHALPKELAGKRVLRVIDHCNVYLLVFGTYVPVALLGVSGALGWSLFGLVATFTLIGIVTSALDVDRYTVIQVACHLICGWSIVFGFARLFDTMGTTGALLILTGGIVYTVGSALYALGARHRFVHGVFHLFCLAGTLLHFLAIYTCLL